LHVLRTLLLTGLFTLPVALLPAVVHAAPCAGFTDVDDSSSFCPNVEWLKNRSVTLGCTSTTLYCPTDLVNRLSMAAFMNRVGTALTPAFLRKRDASTTLSLATERIVCVTDPFAVTGFPRTAIVQGMLNIYTPDAGLDVRAAVVVSTDNGTTWSLSGTEGNAYGALHSGLTPADDLSLYPTNFIDLNVGASYRFAIRATRLSGTGAVVNLYCENLVQVHNRNGASSPFDQGDGGPTGRGP